MSDSSGQPWSNGPNAPEIPRTLYTSEKAYFTGCVIAAMLYGIVVALFFQCMSALLFPAHPTTKGVRWGFVAHTVAVFSFLTIGSAIDRDTFHISYINGREFTGVIPGPLGFAVFASPLRQAIAFLSYFSFAFNQWLTDGLLLYRCFVLYSMNYWVIVFPSLIYLASIVTGILYSYRVVKLYNSFLVYQTTYLSICVSLNVLITLMITIRLALHIRNVRGAIGASSGLGSLYTAIVTMLVESSALNAAGYLLFIAPVSNTSSFSPPPFGEIQAISLFLITLRVTNRSALTSEAVVSDDVGSICFRSRGGTTGGHISSNGETSGQTGVGVEIGSQET